MTAPIKNGTNVVAKRNNTMVEVAMAVSTMPESKTMNMISREPYPDGSGTEPASMRAALIKAIEVSRFGPFPCIARYGITYQKVCMRRHSKINCTVNFLSRKTNAVSA